jgi:hypothetical protein
VEQRHMLRPMGLLEIIDQAFRLYRANFWLFFAIAAVVYIPLGVLQAIPTFGVVVAAVLSPLTYLLSVGALTWAVSERYLGRPASMGEAYTFVAQRFGAFFVTMLCTYLLLAAGLLALFVGVIIVGFWVAFTTQVLVVEGKRNFAAIWRSKFLIGEGVWGQVFVLGLVLGLIGAAIGGVLSGLGALPLAFGRESTLLWLGSGLGQGLGQALVQPLTLIGTVLLYYDSRIRKEGFDLQMLAQELGEQLPLAAVAPVGVVAPPPPTTPEDGSQV